MIRSAYEAANKELNDKIRDLRSQQDTVERDYRQHMANLAAACVASYGTHDMGSEMVASWCKRCGAYSR